MPYTVDDGFVKIPETEFNNLVNELTTLKAEREDAYDRAVLDQALRMDEELLPAEIARRMVEGESPLRVFRTYRRMSQQTLADAAKVSKTTISEIETGRKDGSIKTLIAIAHALNVDLDDLV